MITVTYTARLDGNGVQVRGWYVTHCGVPIGRSYSTKDQAVEASGVYRKDLRACLSSSGYRSG